MAQGATAPPLVAPRAIDAGIVAYPAGASGDGVVVVELVIARDGTVNEARALEGEAGAPFVEATLAAARTWRFEPARRGEVTVSARIRMRVEFHAAVAPAVPVAPASGEPSAVPPEAPAKVDDVKVRGARREPGGTLFSGGEVRQIPGAFGDAFRAIEALPGVTPIVSGLPYFFVRGAPPGNTGYYLDGVRVPVLYHLAFGPSVVHPGMLDHVDFYAGGYPVKYGRFAGGILTGETLPPARRAHAEASLRLYDAGALVEAPFGDGKGSVLLAGRYSYTALVLSLAAPTAKLDYWDYQGRVTWDLTPRDQVGVFVFGSYDFLGDRDRRTGEVKTTFATQFHRVDLRWDHKLSSTGAMRLALTLGLDSTGTEDIGHVRDRMSSLRMSLEERMFANVRGRAGIDVLFDAYDLDNTDPRNVPGGRPDSQTAQIYPPRNELVSGIYGDIVWRVAPGVEIIPGIRFDLFESHRLDRSTIPGDTLAGGLAKPLRTTSALPAVDPRLATRVTITPVLTWVSTFGVSHQPPSFFIPIPGLEIGKLDRGLQTSLQLSQGLEVALPAGFTAVPTVFLHNYLGLTDITATCLHQGSNASGNSACLDDRVRGRTYGLELLVRRPLTKRFTGWLSYTLSRTTREAHPVSLNGVSSPLQTIPGEFDRTHVLSLISAYDLGRSWRVGGRFFFYTGRPYSNEVEGVPVPPYNRERLPAFYRIDLRLEKRWMLGTTSWIALVFEGLNVTLNKEATNVTCSPATTPQSISVGKSATPPLDKCAPETIGPISIPSIGVEASF